VKVVSGFFILLIVLLTSCTTKRPVVPEEISREEPAEPVISEPRPIEEQPRDPETVLPEQKPVDDTVLSPEQPEPVQVSDRASPRPVPVLPPESPYLSRLQSFPPAVSERQLSFRIFPLNARIQAVVGGELRELTAVSRDRDTAYYSSNAGAVLVSAPGYQPRIIGLSRNPETVEAKLERRFTALVKVDEISTDYQPKSVRFAVDGESVYVANLGDFTALTQFNVAPLKRIRSFEVPEKYRRDSGFVETLILPGRNEIWLSQMNRNVIHIFDISSGEYLAGIEVSGVWPKVLAASADETRVYVSCWDSKTIVEIDTGLRQELRSFHTSGTPRGLVLSPDGRSLLAAMFSSSGIDRIDLTRPLRAGISR